jgi:hypothetical protein
MADHIFSDVDWNESSAIMNRDSMLNEFWEDGGTSRPGLDDFLLTGFVLLLNSLEELWITIWTLL